MKKLAYLLTFFLLFNFVFILQLNAKEKCSEATDQNRCLVNDFFKKCQKIYKKQKPLPTLGVVIDLSLTDHVTQIDLEFFSEEPSVLPKEYGFRLLVDGSVSSEKSFVATMDRDSYFQGEMVKLEGIGDLPETSTLEACSIYSGNGKKYAVIDRKSLLKVEAESTAYFKENKFTKDNEDSAIEEASKASEKKAMVKLSSACMPEIGNRLYQIRQIRSTEEERCIYTNDGLDKFDNNYKEVCTTKMIAICEVDDKDMLASYIEDEKYWLAKLIDIMNTSSNDKHWGTHW